MNDYSIFFTVGIDVGTTQQPHLGKFFSVSLAAGFNYFVIIQFNYFRVVMSQMCKGRGDLLPLLGKDSKYIGKTKSRGIFFIHISK